MDRRARRPMLRLLTAVDLCTIAISCLLVWNSQVASAADSTRQHQRVVALTGDKTSHDAADDTNVEQLLADAVPAHVSIRKLQNSDFRTRDRADDEPDQSAGPLPADVAFVRQVMHGGAQGDEIRRLLYQQQTAFNPIVDEADYVADADDLARSKKKVHFGFHAMRGRRSIRTRN